jgi:hypothetical protein
VKKLMARMKITSENKSPMVFQTTGDKSKGNGENHMHDLQLQLPTRLNYKSECLSGWHKWRREKKYHENNGRKIKEKLTFGTGRCRRMIKLKQTP